MSDTAASSLTVNGLLLSQRLPFVILLGPAHAGDVVNRCAIISKQLVKTQKTSRSSDVTTIQMCG